MAIRKAPAKAVKKAPSKAKKVAKKVSKKKSPTKGKGSKKGKKDPNKPKRALSPYIYFVKANRNKIIAAQRLDTKDISSVGKALGVAWGQLSDAQKKPYQAKAQQDKKRSEKERKAYKATQLKKHGMSSYACFMKDTHHKHCKGISSFKNKSKKMSEAWKKLSPAEKKKYEDMSKKTKSKK